MMSCIQTWTFETSSIGLSATRFLSTESDIFDVKSHFSVPVRNKEWEIFGTKANRNTQFGSTSVIQNNCCRFLSDPFLCWTIFRTIIYKIWILSFQTTILNFQIVSLTTTICATPLPWCNGFWPSWKCCTMVVSTVADFSQI